HDGRHALLIGRIHHNELHVTRDFVHLFLHGDTLMQFLEVNNTRDFRQNRERIRIPFEQILVALYRRTVFHENLRAVHNLVALLLAVLFVDNGEDRIAVHRDQFALRITNGVDAEELHKSIGLRILFGLLARTRCRTADMEGTHGELSAGLTDGLRRYDTDRFPTLDQTAGCKVASVAKLAHAALRFAGQHRADTNALDTCCLNGDGQFLGDLFVHMNDDFAFVIELI